MKKVIFAFMTFWATTLIVNAQAFPECYIMSSFPECVATLNDGSSLKGNLNILLTDHSVVMVAGGDTTVVKENRNIIRLETQDRVFIRNGRTFAEILDTLYNTCLARVTTIAVKEPPKTGNNGFQDEFSTSNTRQNYASQGKLQRSYVRRHSLVLIRDGSTSVASLRSICGFFIENRNELKFFADKFNTDFSNISDIKDLLDAVLVEPSFVEKEENWDAFFAGDIYDNGVMSENPGEYFREYHPLYAERRSDIMATLKREYNHRIGKLLDNQLHWRDFASLEPDIEKELVRQCINILEKDGTVSVNGFRTITSIPMHRFDNIYKWYNCGAADGYTNFWSDTDLIRKTGLDFKTIDRAACCAECEVKNGESSLLTLLYFDDDCQYLFRIDVIRN